MENVTITLPIETAYELLSLVSESKNTSDVDWNEHMKLVEKKLKAKL